MAIGFGPGSDMVRATNKQRSSRKKRSLKESSAGTEITGKKEGGLKFKAATPEQLQAIREKMQLQNKKKLQLSIVLIAFLAIFAVLGLIYF